MLLLAPSDPPNTSSFDTDSAAALVHALIASHVDYCNALLAEAPRAITDRFQRVLNAATRVVSGTRKFDLFCLNCFTPSYIGWTFLNVSSISSESQFTGVCRIRLLGKRRTDRRTDALSVRPSVSWMEFETNGRTDGQTRTITQRPQRSPPSRRVDVAATRDKRTDGQTPRIIFATSVCLSVRPSVRPSLRWSLTLYLMDCCTRISDVSSRQRRRSANRRQLTVPRHRHSTFGRRAFSAAGPMEWNSLPHSLRDPARSADSFRSALKTHLRSARGRVAL